MKMKKISYFSLLLIIIASPSLFAFTHEDLATEVMLNNPSIINSGKDIDLAKLDIKDAKAAYQPNIELLSTGTYMVNPPIGKIVVNPEDYVNGQTGTSGSLSSLSALGLDGPLTVFKGMEDTYYKFDLKLTQPLLTWNKISTSVEIYNKVLAIKNLQNSSLFKKLTSELEGREAAIYYLMRMSKNLEEQNEIANQLIEIVKEAQLNDLVLEQDVLEAQIKAKQIEVGMKELEKEENIQLSKIIELTNNRTLDTSSIEYIVDEGKILDLLKTDTNLLIKQATSSQSDSIKILTILKSVKEDEKTIAKNSIYYKPDLALQIEASYSGYRLPLVEKGYYTQDQAGLNITIALKSTIWDGGKKINDIARKRINEEQAANNIKEATNKILQTINENIYTMKLAESNIEYQKLNSQIIENKICNLTQEYEEGYTNQADLLKAKLELKASELERIKQQLEMATSYFTIMYLIK